MGARRATLLSAALCVAAAASVVGACDGTFRFDEPASPSTEDGGGDESTGSACTDDATCGALRCEKTSGVCVACLGDGDCSGVRPHCDATAHVCVECEQSSDCGTKQRCDVTTHRCLDTCLDEDDLCPTAGFVCSPRVGGLGLCVECRSTANCAGSLTGHVCDVSIGRCVQCTGNAQCAGATPACDRRDGQCVGCITSTACPSPTTCDKFARVCR